MLKENSVTSTHCISWEESACISHFTNYSGVNQKLMGKSMCVSGAVKDAVVRGVMCESDSPPAVRLNASTDPRDMTIQIPWRDRLRAFRSHRGVSVY